jgi:hypothetical protein
MDNLMPGTWDTDPIEGKEIFIEVCNDCGKIANEYTQDCECENPSGISWKDATQCPICEHVWLTAEEFETHSNCEPFWLECDY